MKKVCFLLISVILILFSAVSAFADEGPVPGTSTMLSEGIYMSGIDFPTGSYTIRCADPSDYCSFLLGATYLIRWADPGDFQGDYASYGIYLWEGESFRLPLGKGDVLGANYPLNFSVSDPVEIVSGQRNALERGIYRIGTDIPAGSYVIECGGENDGCHFILTSDSLIKLNDPFAEIPSQSLDLYIDAGTSYRAFFEEDGLFYPSGAVYLTPAEPLSFN